jgi:hypothetical protein
LYVAGATTDEPIPFILENDKLGLSYWCVIELYKFSLGELKATGARQNKGSRCSVLGSNPLISFSFWRGRSTKNYLGDEGNAVGFG